MDRQIDECCASDVLENAMTVKVIAEIGCNHKGDMEIAREMIMIAVTVC
jgi:N-acetylneuraminate synthase